MLVRQRLGLTSPAARRTCLLHAVTERLNRTDTQTHAQPQLQTQTQKQKQRQRQLLGHALIGIIPRHHTRTWTALYHRPVLFALSYHATEERCITGQYSVPVVTMPLVPVPPVTTPSVTMLSVSMRYRVQNLAECVISSEGMQGRGVRPAPMHAM